MNLHGPRIPRIFGLAEATTAPVNASESSLGATCVRAWKGMNPAASREMRCAREGRVQAGSAASGCYRPRGMRRNLSPQPSQTIEAALSKGGELGRDRRCDDVALCVRAALRSSGAAC